MYFSTTGFTAKRLKTTREERKEIGSRETLNMRRIRILQKWTVYCCLSWVALECHIKENKGKLFYCSFTSNAGHCLYFQLFWVTIDDSQKHFIYKGSCKIDVQSLPQQFHSIQQMLGCNEAFVSNFNGDKQLFRVWQQMLINFQKRTDAQWKRYVLTTTLYSLVNCESGSGW